MFAACLVVTPALAIAASGMGAVHAPPLALRGGMQGVARKTDLPLALAARITAPSAREVEVPARLALWQGITISSLPDLAAREHSNGASHALASHLASSEPVERQGQAAGTGRRLR
ncbi:MAG TPA: hypothetical protein VHL79_01965 [Ramlibacter sp.]|jgi:hypothetical protein|nr:hypothetical protein [Ramlibacter sp.]